MSHDPAQALVDRLEARGFAPRPTGPDSWESRCPGHDGSRHNLSIRRGDDGRALLHCFHGGTCDYRSVAAALGMAESDLFPPRDDRARPQSTSGPARPKRVHPTPDDAIAGTAAWLGAPTAHWPYHDADGREAMRVYRFDPDGGEKEFRPVHATDGGWAMGDPAGPLLLYRRPELADADPVVFTEGEKACDAARRIGLTATTTAHGAKSPHKSDLAPLGGKTVIICPDHDEPGEAYTQALVGLLAKLNPRPTVKVVRLADLWRTDAPIPEGADLVEWLADGVPDTWTEDECRAELARAVGRAPAVDLDVPIPSGPTTDGEPAKVETPPADPFPLDVLPDAASRLVIEGASAIGCPPDFLALPVLAIAGGVIGRSVVLRLKDGYLAHPAIFAVSVGPPSDGKTPALKAVAGAARRIGRELVTEHGDALSRWQEESERPGPEGKRAKATPAPRPRRIDVDDITMEALPLILSDNPRGLVMVRDELTAFVSGMNQYKGGKGSDRAVTLKLWSGDAITRDRVGHEGNVPVRCPHPCLSIVGGMTPDMLGTLADPKGNADGFVDRLLFTFPDPRPIAGWSEAGIADATADDWHDLLARLWRRPMADGDGEPTPHVARFDGAGRLEWVRHFDAHTAEMNAPGFDPALRGPWGKLREYAGRLALILACLDHAADTTADPEVVPEVGPRAVEGAWRLVGYFKGHARKVHAVISGARWAGGDAGRLLDALRSAPGGMTRTEIRDRVFRRNKDSEAIGEILDGLAGKGLAHSRPEATGGRPAERWFAGDDPTR